MCRKSTTWDRRLCFLSEGRHAEDFFARKIRRLQTALNPRTWVPEASMLTARPLKLLKLIISIVLIYIFSFVGGLHVKMREYRMIPSTFVSNASSHTTTLMGRKLASLRLIDFLTKLLLSHEVIFDKTTTV
jgi:hypothetical protein